MKTLCLVGLVAALVCSSQGMGAVHFSLHPSAHTLALYQLSPADVLVSSCPGTVSLWRSGDQLGLDRKVGDSGGDNLNALSFGWDKGAPIVFSVDPYAQGLPGSDVNWQYVQRGPHLVGGLFETLPPVYTNLLWCTTDQLGLTRDPASNLEEDINALSLVPWHDNVYFSIDEFSESIDPGQGILASSIYVNDLSNVFADYSNIGLDAADDLDALLLWDGKNRGMMDPQGDYALFSLSRDSPTLSLLDGGGQPRYSPGDIFYTNFTGEFSVWKTASQVGLRPSTADGNVITFGDELNALSSIVPEPGTFVMWGLLAIAWPLACRIRKRRGTVPDGQLRARTALKRWAQSITFRASTTRNFKRY